MDQGNRFAREHPGALSTRRLHPSICDFTSSVFYEGRLKPIAELEKQRVIGSGLWVIAAIVAAVCAVLFWRTVK